jgi:UDP-N-acetylmuramoylalanine--D-glutamate ligase
MLDTPHFYIYKGKLYVFLPASNETDFRAWLASNTLQVCYPLATPIELTLTPAELELLKGYNYISTNGTTISLDYLPDSLLAEAENYVDAKMRITQNQTEDDAFIFWNDDPSVKEEMKRYNLKAQLFPFSEFKGNGAIAYAEKGQYVIEVPTPFNMELEELALTGKHNLYNSLAAGITANIAGVDNKTLRECLSNFEGVEHRLEKAGRVRGIDFVNDSKATNVNACWYALESMKQPTVLILGGIDKGNDYTEIYDLVREKCVGLVFLGVDNKKLHENFDSFGLPIVDVQSMKDCVDACYKMAHDGDCVLLSPCCASFDLFKNMEDRGEQFKHYVSNL